MKQLFSALLTVTLIFQPLLAQTPTTQIAPKSGKEEPAEVVPIEDLLPGDTLAYVASTNLAGLLHSLELLDAYKVAQARMPKEELEGGDNPLSVVTQFLSFGIQDARTLEDTRIGFAVLLPEMPELTEEKKKAQSANPNYRPPMPEPLILVFVEGAQMEQARQAREQFLQYYSETFKELGKLSEVKQTDYKGAKLDRFKTGEVGMWFGATYVLSQPAALDRLLALRADRRAARLADDQEFVRARLQMIPQTGLFAYLNGKPLNHLLGTVLGNARQGGLGLGGLDSLIPFAFSADAIKSIALSSTFDREGVVDRLALNFDPAKNNLLTALFSGPKNEFKATQYIPAGTEILVSHSVDWVKVYDELVVKLFYRELARAELMQEYLAKYENKEKEAQDDKSQEKAWIEAQKLIQTELTEDKLEKKAKEREAEINTELGYIVREEAAKDLANEVTIAYGIPKPVFTTVDDSGEEGKKNDEGWAVFVGIKDRVATQQALIKAFAYLMGGMMNAGNRGDDEGRQNAPPKTEEQRQQERELRNQNALSAWAVMPTETYKKVEIKSIFAAHLGFSEEYLIVADSKETIKQMLDAAEGGRAMTSDFNYSRALSNLSGSSTTKVFVGPKLFDGILNDFIKSWVANPNTLPSDLSARAQLNVPATAAAALESDQGSIKLELFSPLGIAGMFALWGFGSEVKSTTERKETEARYKLRQLAKAQKVYAKKHHNLYASLETLAKMNDVDFKPESLKDEKNNYRFAFQLKPGGKGYEATATPIKYGRQGRKSFFIDESGKLREADKQGAVATVADDEAEAWEMEEQLEAKDEGEKPPPRPVRRRRR